MWADGALIIGSYLFGSLPHLSGLAKLRGIKLEGDSHLSLWRRGGRLVGTIGILGEFVRGIIPVLAGRNLGFGLMTVVLAGLAVVVGQMWPIFSGFDGEKGNSVGLAMAGALAPYVVFIALVPIITGVAIRTVPRLLDRRESISERLKFGGPPSLSLPLGMAIGFFVMPFAGWGLGEPVVVNLGLLMLFVLIMVRRLTAGLKSDFKQHNGIRMILINRFLYDRSYR